MATLIYALQNFTGTDSASYVKGNTYTVADSVAYVAYQRGQAQPASLQEDANFSTLNQLQYDAGATGVAGTDGTGNLIGPDGLPISVGGGESLLPKFKAALAKTRNGASITKLLMLGHSHIVGSGANGVGYVAGGRAKNSTVRLTSLLNTYFAPANSHSGIGWGNIFGSTLPQYDPRFTLTNWNTGSLNNAIGGVYNSNTSGAVMSFTPIGDVDTFIVYYARNPGQGTFNLDIDGGSATSVNANASSAIGVQSISAGSAGSHTLNITKTNSTNNYILGIIAYNSTLKEICVIQAGQSGAKAADIAVSTNAWDGINEILAVAPDLTYIQISINDWVAGTNINAFKASVQLLINAALISGDVVLSTDVPSNISNATQSVQKNFVTAINELADANGLLVVDLYGRAVDFVTANSLGLMADNLHRNGAGYFDDAYFISKTVTAAT